MKMMGAERIAAPRSRVWDALNDPEILRQCIPGCQSLERQAADKLAALVEVKIGPIGARFKGTVTLSDIDAPRSYTLTGEGQGGTVGSAKAVIEVQLAEEGNATTLSYEVDAQVGGRLAQLGGPLIDATAKQLAGKFFKRFGELVGTAKVGAPISLQPTAAGNSSATASPVPQIPLVERTTNAFPIAWVLALTVAALVGFLVGRGHNDTGGSDWVGIAIGLLIGIVAAASFEFGRRSASTQIVIDAASLQRVLRGEKQ